MKTTARIVSRREQNQRSGAMTVEFAIVAPVIFFVFIGSIEMANLNFIRNMANDAAYQVARRHIVPGGSNSTAPVDDAKALLATAGIDTVTFTTTESTESVSVTVDVPIDQNSWGLGKFIKGKTISQTCQMTKQVKSSTQ